ncbi:unnamed protein product [Cylindrotheca closterium]|uniref:Uncharacterized protein n=1 Tax=Cylindrotheca closterium TaxID=2856 RepID=A0AAD2GAS1_9STRA|nr:unnamed protein product [Cylindrotheca closterium]
MMLNMDYWNDSIKLNNLGVESLQQGQLDRAAECFRKASELNAEASYDSPLEGYGVYSSQWITLAHMPLHQMAVGSISATPPCVLAIGDKVPKDSCVHDSERQSNVFVTRLDWIIEFNLATTLQLYSTHAALSGCCSLLLRESFQLYGEVAQDLLEWNNYSATMDLAMFLMTIYSHQASICAQWGERKLALLYRRRLDRIRHCCAHTTQAESQRQQITLALCESQCAPCA